MLNALAATLSLASILALRSRQIKKGQAATRLEREDCVVLLRKYTILLNAA